MNLALIGNTALRVAIRRNLVNFLSQIPAFAKGGDERKIRAAAAGYIRDIHSEVRDVPARVVSAGVRQ